MPEIKCIIWDWNGTLFNDRDYCLSCINLLLDKRKLPKLTLEQYLDIFTFPVRDYYEKIGFDFTKEAWNETAQEFMDAYNYAIPDITIFEGASAILNRIQQNKTRQFIISAMEKSLLEKLVNERQIRGYFDGVFGIEDHFAHSKKDIAEQVFNSQNFSPETSLWIGDSLHDYEIASELGTRVLLLASGHQSKKRLEKTNVPVFDNLKEIENYLIEMGIIE